MTAAHLHHRVPRCLLRSYDRACEGELDAAGLQAWFDWEEEAFRYGVDPDVSREDLAGLIEASATPIPAVEHRSYHSEAGDFARWGRQGGVATLALYGSSWFSLLGRRRWGLVSAEDLARYRVEQLATKSGAV